MKLIKCLILTLALGLASSAHAVPIQFGFFGSVSDTSVPALLGTAFNGTALAEGTGVGFEALDGFSNGLTFTFNYLGFIWTEADDPFATLFSNNGEFAGWDLFAVNGGSLTLDIVNNSFLIFDVFGDFVAGTLRVPEPGTLGLLGIGLLGFALARRRKTS